MRQLEMLFVLAFAGCATQDTSSDGTGDHLIVHIANDVPFDRADYHFQAPATTTLTIVDYHVLPLRSTAQWDEWTRAGHGWTDVTAYAFADGQAIATGTIHAADYVDEGNGLFLADVTIQLTPVP